MQNGVPGRIMASASNGTAEKAFSDGTKPIGSACAAIATVRLKLNRLSDLASPEGGTSIFSSGTKICSFEIYTIHRGFIPDLRHLKAGSLYFPPPPISLSHAL